MYTEDDRNRDNSVHDNLYHGGGDRSRLDDVIDMVKDMHTTLANTPDLNKDGIQGDVSLIDYRQYLVDELGKVNNKLDELNAKP
jgi:hypothetical protein